jgi:hypothetical protein
MSNEYYDSLNTKQRARWIALISAVDLIESSCKKYHKNFDTIDIKPSALKKFIDTMSVKYEQDIIKDEQSAVNKQNFIHTAINNYSYTEQQS